MTRKAWRLLSLALALLATPNVSAQEVPELAWNPCPEAPHEAAECGSVPQPLDHSAPDDRTVYVAVGRIASLEPSRPRTQFWYLPGGPGDSGIEALGRLHALFGDLGVDLYTLDPRGYLYGSDRATGLYILEYAPTGGVLAATVVDGATDGPIQGIEILRGCRGLNLVGGDLVEVAPPYDRSGNTALLGANLLYELLCSLPGVAIRNA